MRYQLQPLYNILTSPLRGSLWGLLLVAVTSLSSCGLAQLDPEEQPQLATALTLGRDTVDVMVGDSMLLSPTLLPADVGKRMFVWSMDNEDIISISNDTVTAIAEGETRLTAISLLDNLTDSCYVRVWKRWQEPDLSEYQLYETPILARATFKGQPLTPYMTVAAFVNHQLRCIAVPQEHYGIHYLLMRVWNDRLNDPREPDLDDEDNPRPYKCYITFKLYDRQNHRMYDFPEELPFDSETHGMLSNLLQLNIE